MLTLSDLRGAAVRRDVAALEGALLPLDQVDLDQLADVLDGTDGGDLDLATGETWHRLEDDLEVDEDSARVHVPGRGSHEAWRDREAFAEALDDRRGQRLLDALHRRGPFRAFAGALDRHPDLVGEFLAHRGERQLGRARAWLLDEGVLDPQGREQPAVLSAVRWSRRTPNAVLSPLKQELAQIAALVEQVRLDLYSIEPRYRRHLATTALAASVAERVYRMTAGQPDLHNAASDDWRGHLEHVWGYLAGDEKEHYALSAAVGNYLLSPLNHNEGQDGPDDMDRPQTVAALAAVNSAISWAVDFAEDAIHALFEAVELKYDGEMLPSRAVEVAALAQQVADDCSALRKAFAKRPDLSPDLLAALRR